MDPRLYWCLRWCVCESRHPRAKAEDTYNSGGCDNLAITAVQSIRVSRIGPRKAVRAGAPGQRSDKIAIPVDVRSVNAAAVYQCTHVANLDSLTEPKMVVHSKDNFNHQLLAWRTRGGLNRRTAHDDERAILR